jgi:hypothetical protein
MSIINKKFLIGMFLYCFSCAGFAQGPQNLSFESIPGTKARNIIFILSDDHRYDFMGFTGKVPGLKTPNLDRMANEGAHFQNAFVSTALCSPSRASILTGQYAHTHTVVDNQASAPSSLIYFPQYLQKAGYQTSFFGKWHMGGGGADPRPGFNRWASFAGQGDYYNPKINIDGKMTNYTDSTYVTDVLTDLTLQWLDKRDKNKPFFVYLSHKAVHADFYPAKRDKGSIRISEFSILFLCFLRQARIAKDLIVVIRQIQVLIYSIIKISHSGLEHSATAGMELISCITDKPILINFMWIIWKL